MIILDQFKDVEISQVILMNVDPGGPAVVRFGNGPQDCPAGMIVSGGPSQSYDQGLEFTLPQNTLLSIPLKLIVKKGASILLNSGLASCSVTLIEKS